MRAAIEVAAEEIGLTGDELLEAERHADLRHHARDQRGRHQDAPPRPRSSPPAGSATSWCSRKAASTTRTTIATTIRRPISRAATPSRSTSASTRRATWSRALDRAQARDVVRTLQGAQVRGGRGLPDVVDRQRRAREGARRAARRGAARRALHAVARADPDRARVSPRLDHRDRRVAQAADAAAPAARWRATCARPASAANC